MRDAMKSLAPTLAPAFSRPRERASMHVLRSFLRRLESTAGRHPKNGPQGRCGWIAACAGMTRTFMPKGHSAHTNTAQAAIKVIAFVRCVLSIFVFGLSLNSAAVTVTDDRGQTVNIPLAPQRIVSLLPSLTETVCALGACARLVGVDRYSNYPLQVKKLAQMGGGIDPNIEAIVAAKPDLVLMATSARGVQRLESLGLKVLALESKNVADVQRTINLLGQVLQAADAPVLWREIEAAMQDAKQSLPPATQRLRVYFEASSGPYAAGPQSFIGEMLARLGVQNIISSDLGPFPKINPEFVVRADPDLIMLSARSAQDLAKRPGWSQLRAVRAQHVCGFTTEQNDVLVRAGPRMAQAAGLLARCIAGVKTP